MQKANSKKFHFLKNLFGGQNYRYSTFIKCQLAFGEICFAQSMQNKALPQAALLSNMFLGKSVELYLLEDPELRKHY